MKYFINEQERRESHSTCYFEFQRGRYNGECWREDSLNITDESFVTLTLDRIFMEVIPEFDYFGTTEVNREQWIKIKELLTEKGGECEEVLTELEPWVNENFAENKFFCVWGM